MNKLDCYILNDSAEQHTHAYAQIFLPLAGVLELHCSNADYTILPNELGFIPPDTLHRCMCKNKLLTINIPSDMIKKEDMQILSHQIVFPIKGPLIPLIELIKEEISSGKRDNSIRYLFYYLYDKLIENHRTNSIRYIQEHFEEAITVAELAKMENYNISYFNEWFKRQTGCSPANYLKRVRIEKAKELIVSTDYTMMEIALQVGYHSHAAFTRAFSKTTGFSPAQYRAER